MAPSRSRSLFIFLLLLAAVNAYALPGEPEKPVMVRWQGINFPAHLLSVEGDRFHIRYDEHRDGRPDDEWVGRDRIRNKDYSPFEPVSERTTAASAAAPKAPTSNVIPPGRYACYVFISGSGLVNNGEFMLSADGTYERGGTRGRWPPPVDSPSREA